MKSTAKIILIFLFASVIFSSGCRENKIVYPEELAEGAVHINSNPRGASVFIRGEFTNKITPDWFENLDSGYHRFTLKFEGYADTTVSVNIESSQKKYLLVSLRSID